MKFKFFILFAAIALAAGSCRKDRYKPPPVPGVQWKDMVIPGLPSPYYYYEYDAQGRIIYVSHASGIRSYEITYSGNRIAQVKNNTITNQDRLEYIYTDNDQLADGILFYDKHNVQYQRCFTFYNQQGQLLKLDWERKIPATGFAQSRTVTFTYYPGGNVQEIDEYRPAIPGVQQEWQRVNTYMQYDDKVNVTWMPLLHFDGEHLLLLPGIQPLQKNNPRKNIISGAEAGLDITYQYIYGEKNVPLERLGHVRVTAGPNQGQEFDISAAYTYY